jgi:hypothetical protein
MTYANTAAHFLEKTVLNNNALYVKTLDINEQKNQKLLGPNVL